MRLRLQFAHRGVTDGLKPMTLNLVKWSDYTLAFMGSE